MVELEKVRSSNKQVSTVLPPGLVAVYVGATSGIGELAMKALVKHSVQPRVYFVGRSQKAADRITSELKALNSAGEYIFIQADISLITGVDKVCQQIKARETAINLLVQSQGSMDMSTITSEKLRFSISLVHYSRARFIANLLPLIQESTGIRRVVSVLAGTKEGNVHVDDIQGWNIPLMSMRGHLATLVTLTMAHFAEHAPTVSFVHDFPGHVRSNFGREMKGVLKALGKVYQVVSPLFSTPGEEVGERHLFYSTSNRYPARSRNPNVVVPLPIGVPVAKGFDGKLGSGVYSVDGGGDECGPSVVALLGDLCQKGTVEEVWKDVAGEFIRITGVEAI
ncbi:hypothetical protein UA08_00734 [Talaromyces atroroseus]|uniref:Ketoreductase (KR) domain-containing protein n=1 Tax=Talaromyces atroroseus TaxID=1441469 RepID=A0A225B8N3_TALAT|nr:hypothetical protein UA08_00734 [Talaromyces atroroseus]OKL63756.1 hypothetical protein UA08_00734 [Talaromyces atroroseus]